MSYVRPPVLTIAGFDPCGGAGVLADIKTFLRCKTQGMAVITALTIQNQTTCEAIEWLEVSMILRQLQILKKENTFRFIKIGMIQNLKTLEQIILSFSEKDSPVHFIWDPILKTSSGFVIHPSIEQEHLFSILKHIFLITPNAMEARALSGMTDELEGARMLSQYCNVLLKGGHREQDRGRDFLFLAPALREGKLGTYSFRPKKVYSVDKHGSGCVFSAALTAYLAHGYNLLRACLKAKDEVTWFLGNRE